MDVIMNRIEGAYRFFFSQMRRSIFIPLFFLSVNQVCRGAAGGGTQRTQECVLTGNTQRHTDTHIWTVKFEDSPLGRAHTPWGSPETWNAWSLQSQLENTNPYILLSLRIKYFFNVYDTHFFVCYHIGWNVPSIVLLTHILRVSKKVNCRVAFTLQMGWTLHVLFAFIWKGFIYIVQKIRSNQIHSERNVCAKDVNAWR